MIKYPDISNSEKEEFTVPHSSVVLHHGEYVYTAYSPPKGRELDGAAHMASIIRNRNQ